MLSKEQNERLTWVGPGTPMGELLRIVDDPPGWLRHHAGAMSARGCFADLWRGRGGRSPPRLPRTEVRLSGNCIEQPAEPGKSTFMRHVKAFAGKAPGAGRGGVGIPSVLIRLPNCPAPTCFVDPRFVDVGHSMLPCNWLQIMENSVDPHHVEWLHGRYFDFLGAQQGFVAPKSFQKKHLKVGFDAMEWGILKRRVLEGHTEEDDGLGGGTSACVFAHSMRVGGAGIDQMQIRVPIDDTTT